MILENESRRLGELWRSQGEAFLIEQAEILAEDVERLRASYVKTLKVRVVTSPPKSAPMSAPAATTVVEVTEEEVVIDLRDNSLQGVYCSRKGHTFDKAVARCTRCKEAFCEDDIVRPPRLKGNAVCTDCALDMAGVNHKRYRPLARARRR